MDPSLLDTDILSEALKQKNSIVVQRTADYLQQFGTLAFSVVSRYEIVRGLKYKHATALLPRFEIICQRSLVLGAPESVFKRAADLWVAARLGGHAAGDADLLIASTALETGRTLVTGNTVHFAWIPKLKLEDWRA
jgi:predicted nucleic acid-binding protein